MPGVQLIGSLWHGIGAATRLAYGVCLLLVFLWLAASGWERLMDATNQLGMDPTRDRLYEQGAAPHGLDLSPFPPQERVVTNSVGMKLILVPPGECVLGSPSYEEFRGADEMPHRTRITRAFYLGAYEVTVGQFRQFVAHSGYVTDLEQCPSAQVSLQAVLGAGRGASLTPTWQNPGFAQTEDHPVVDVSWQDAMVFCAWLSRRGGARIACPPRRSGNMPVAQGPSSRFSRAGARMSGGAAPASM